MCNPANLVPRVLSWVGENPGNEVATQLVEVLDQIGTNVDRGGQVDIIYLDRSKA